MDTLKMAKKSHTFFTFLLFSFLFFSPTQAEKTTKTQTNALDDLYTTKFFKNANHYSKVKEKNSASDFKVKIIAQKGSKEGDRIGSLPGQPKVSFGQYGGYVTIDEKAGRAFYYYFAEAEKARHSKPLLLWLNGGPGCSSLAYGAMTELGPFRVHSDGKTLYNNPFAWNNAANVLFLESPAGVGFSYSNTSSDVENSGDRKTSEDNLIFILNWLERFPEYKDREFYISGESYAGHYGPQLAHNILLHNEKAKKTLVNLKGIFIGNAVINDQADALGIYDYYNTHTLISDEVLSKIKTKCDFVSSYSKECITALGNAGLARGLLNVYNIYYPKCQNSNLTEYPKKASVLKFDPCSDHYVYAYLNNPLVQEALHANVTKLSYDWQPCSDLINWEDSPSSTLPLLKEFMENGLRVWVFSGDTDGRVPVTSTKYSLQKMNLTVKDPYYPWFLEKEVGGYTEVYEGNLTFATVRGAGHEVPSYQPARALSLIMHFLNGTNLSKKS